MKNIFSKDNAKTLAIKTTGIVLGSAYILSKTFAEGCKKLEATIVSKIDSNYTKKEVRRYRMESYFEVHNKINNKVVQMEILKARLDLKVRLINAKLHKSSYKNEITLMDKDLITC